MEATQGNLLRLSQMLPASHRGRVPWGRRERPHRARPTVLGLLSLLTVCGAGCGAPQFLPPPDCQVRGEAEVITRPVKRRSSLGEEILHKTLSYQLKQILDLPRGFRKLSGHPYEALNVDNFDEVPNSSWFTNRNGTEAMSLEAVRRGPNRSSGPVGAGPWTVVALKSVGVTPGMTIVDARGDRFIIKFDPPAYPELPSGAEMVAARLFHAAGYNVPENYVAYLDPAWLVPSPDALVMVQADDDRRPLSKRPLRQEDIDATVHKANPGGQVPIRVLASRFLPGTPVGPWPYTGTRRDDANDLYPHEHRRELRGLYIISSWLNNADMKEENTLDMYDAEAGAVTHYLIDFGASLGSSSTNPSSPRRGQANSLDLKHSLTRLMTLGLYVYEYEGAPNTVDHPSVGYLGNDLFRPDSWKPMYPAPPFENLTRRDAFWGTKIVTSFTDAQIGAAVAAGEFTDPEAGAALEEFLVERRDRIGRFWLARVNALDGFRIASPDTLRFVDLGVDRGYTSAPKDGYQCRVVSPSGEIVEDGVLEAPMLPLPSAWKTHDYITVSLLPQRPETRAAPVLVYLEPRPGTWIVTGLRRLD